MDVHVDVVKNEWLAGYQVVVARLSVIDGRIEVDSPQPDRWRAFLLRPLVDVKSGESLYPEKDPEHFLEALSVHVNGTYLFATEVHSVEECPYEGVVVPMQAVSLRPRASQSA